jgi:hypothetical protein
MRSFQTSEAKKAYSDSVSHYVYSLQFFVVRKGGGKESSHFQNFRHEYVKSEVTFHYFAYVLHNLKLITCSVSVNYRNHKEHLGKADYTNTLPCCPYTSVFLLSRNIWCNLR